MTTDSPIDKPANPIKNAQAFDNEKFAEAINVKAFRARYGQNEAARAIGVSTSTISRIVSKRKKPDIDSLVRILHWLDMKFEEFVR